MRARHHTAAAAVHDVHVGGKGPSSSGGVAARHHPGTAVRLAPVHRRSEGGSRVFWLILLVLVVVSTLVFFAIQHKAGKDGRLREVVDSAVLILQERPLEVVDTLERALGRVRSQRPTSPASAAMRTYLLDTLGDAHHICANFNDSFRYYRESLEYKLLFGSPPGDVAETYQALAAVVQVIDPYAALGYLGSALDLPDLAPAARASIVWRQAKGYECAADFKASLERLDAMVALDPRYGQDLTWRGALMATLAKTLQLQKGLSDAVRADLARRLAQVKEALLRDGPWSDPEQMPPVSTYSSGLKAQPWHDLHDPAWERPVQGGRVAATLLQDAAALVMAATPRLKSEFFDLQRAAKLRIQGECISSKRGGSWSFLEVESPWEEKGADGCVAAAPAACRLVASLRNLGMPVVRAGYSVVEAGTHLLPHTGVTNRELKWHLGLLVPSMPPGCATLRVGSQARSWKEGGLLFFDDSFEHEVKNSCAETRAVFQIVFRHVELWGAA